MTTPKRLSSEELRALSEKVAVHSSEAVALSQQTRAQADVLRAQSAGRDVTLPPAGDDT
ncbi:hypothetical protein [uncultured Tateyamaria sp.]|uniref:hypothetical protein n=1 Tax=uncultured Tateyamaria sp. TaxID=455651 RepID=UPI00261152F8|nr:hypothetical protein [uncultured Tateyamaria sp.]